MHGRKHVWLLAMHPQTLLHNKQTMRSKANIVTYTQTLLHSPNVFPHNASCPKSMFVYLKSYPTKACARKTINSLKRTLLPTHKHCYSQLEQLRKHTNQIPPRRKQFQAKGLKKIFEKFW